MNLPSRCVSVSFSRTFCESASINEAKLVGTGRRGAWLGGQASWQPVILRQREKTGLVSKEDTEQI